MRNKLQNEELVFYKNLGKFVRERRKNLGYNSAEKLAEASLGLTTASYVKHIETGKGMFGSPDTFTGLAKALGVTPGLMMDILTGYADADGNIIQTSNSINLPENFTLEDRKFIEELISFLGYRKQLEQADTSNPKKIHKFPANKRAKVAELEADAIIMEANPNPTIDPDLAATDNTEENTESK